MKKGAPCWVFPSLFFLKKKKKKSTRKELKTVKNKILCLTEDLEMINGAPKESEEALKKLRQLELENTGIVKEN